MEGVDTGTKSYFVMKYQNDTQGVTKLVTQDGPKWVESKLERKTDQMQVFSTYKFVYSNICNNDCTIYKLKLKFNGSLKMFNLTVFLIWFLADIILLHSY